MTICGESKSGLSTYYVNLRHVKNIFGHIIDRIGKMDLNDCSPIGIFGLSKTLMNIGIIIMNSQHGNMENIISKIRIWINYTVARLRWVVIANTVTKKISVLSV